MASNNTVRSLTSLRIRYFLIIRTIQINRLEIVNKCSNLFDRFSHLDTPLQSIIETPLTDSLVNGIFQQQNQVYSSNSIDHSSFAFLFQDGSFPATNQLGEFFHVDFDRIKSDLHAKGLQTTSKSFLLRCCSLLNHFIDLVADEIHRLISTASILFYFLYHSQKTNFPVDLNAIKQFVSKARAELDGVILVTNIDLIDLLFFRTLVMFER